MSLHWIPYGGERRRGRPATRWEDSLEAYAREYASKWEVLAQDRDVWSAWQEGFVQRAMIKEEAREPGVDSGNHGASLSRLATAIFLTLILRCPDFS